MSAEKTTTELFKSIITELKSKVQAKPHYAPLLRHLERCYQASIEADKIENKGKEDESKK